MNLSGRQNGRSILSEKENLLAAAHRRHARLEHRQSRDEVFARIHALRNEGLSFCEIERQTGFKRRTVAKWLETLRIPTKPAIDSDLKPASHSDFIPAGVPI
ncbi:hypothetical protein ACVILI_006835 [Mesorhizobium sp. USDA 4775]|nr:hypothetical protein MCHK_10975 [Mesorhizobium huakuii 7653R]